MSFDTCYKCGVICTSGDTDMWMWIPSIDKNICSSCFNNLTKEEINDYSSSGDGIFTEVIHVPREKKGRS